MLTTLFARHIAHVPPDQQAIRDKCVHPTGTFIEFKKEQIEQSIPERFEQIAHRYHSRTALKISNQLLTYGELNATANRVAHAILAMRGKGEERVALLFEQGAAPIVALLGALKAGKMYVPLDSSSPRARTADILRDSQSSLIVTDNQNRVLARELAQNGCQLLDVDELDPNLPTGNPGLSIPPDTLAYIIYTSGSTGQPKGVIQSHRNVLHHIMNFVNALHISADDRLTNLHSLSHSAARLDIFGALLSGAALCSFNLKEEGLRNVAGRLMQDEISIYHWIPTAFRSSAAPLTGDRSFPTLRLVVLGSEAAYNSDFELFKQSFPPHCIFVNRLGATETGNVCLYFADKDTRISSNIVPVGYTVEDLQVLLLDDAGEEVGFDCLGEIAVKSRYLSPGYWRKPDLTRTAFLPAGEGEWIYRTGDVGRMRPDGCLEYLGRKGLQLKVRGHGIEISEVEGALTDLPTIKDAVVVGRGDRSEDPSAPLRTSKRLVAYIVPIGKPPTVSTLRRALSEKLPDYMIPSNFVFLDALPLTANGKLDRRALPDSEQSRPELDTPFVPYRTPIEAKLASIWAEVLSLDQVGIHDDFLELGGHSLAATQVISRVMDRFNIELPIRSLFDAPTVADMAEVVTRYQHQRAEQD